MADTRILHTEKVKEGGRKARWPYTNEYQQPTKQGHLFFGWKYNNMTYTPPFENESTNPFGPISDETRIKAVWDRMTIHSGSSHRLISGDGDSDDTLTNLYSWITSTSGNTILDGIYIEEVALDSGMQKINFEDKGTTVAGNKNVTKKKALPNDVNVSKYYRFKAKTDNYGGMESDVIEIEQVGRDQIFLPDFDFLTFTFTWDEQDGKDLDTATYIIGTNIEIENGKYRNKTNGSLISKQDYDGKTEEEKANYEPLTLDYYPVGFNCLGRTGDCDYYLSRPPSQDEVLIFNEVSQYIKGGGDNLQTGHEAALVNWKEICNRDFVSSGIQYIYCILYANWYDFRDRGDCSVEFKIWKTESGTGGMQLDRDSGSYDIHGHHKTLFTFSGTGDTVEKVEYRHTANGNVFAACTENVGNSLLGTTDDQRKYYSHVITMKYSVKDKSATIVDEFNQLQRGRNLTFDCTVDGENRNIGGKSFYNFVHHYDYDDTTEKTFHIQKSDFYVNGVPYQVKFKTADNVLGNSINCEWLEFVSTTRNTDDSIISITVRLKSVNTGLQRDKYFTLSSTYAQDIYKAYISFDIYQDAQ